MGLTGMQTYITQVFPGNVPQDAISNNENMSATQRKILLDIMKFDKDVHGVEEYLNVSS